jgi:hypothetical protein
MAEIKAFKGYQGTPKMPKPTEPVQPNIVTVKDGCPVKYPGCEGIGVGMRTRRVTSFCEEKA